MVKKWLVSGLLFALLASGAVFLYGCGKMLSPFGSSTSVTIKGAVQ